MGRLDPDTSHIDRIWYSYKQCFPDQYRLEKDEQWLPYIIGFVPARDPFFLYQYQAVSFQVYCKNPKNLFGFTEDYIFL